MTEDQKQMIRDWAKAGMEYDTHYKEWCDLGMRSDSGLLESGWLMFSAYTNAVKQFCNITAWSVDRTHDSDLEYFAYECDFGRKPMQITIAGFKFMLDSVDALIELLEPPQPPKEVEQPRKEVEQ